jgi:hypothetical protein
MRGWPVKRDRRKPRASEIRVDFGSKQTISGLHVSEDGTLTFFDEHGRVVEPDRIDVGSVYPRSKKLKVLSRLPGQPKDIQLDPNRGLLRFAFVMAVDTNTLQIGATKVSISIPVLVAGIEIGPARWNAKLVPQDAFEFHDATVPPERVGWWEAITRAKSNPEFRGTIAVIVDSDLGDLAALNSRKQQILKGFYLPDGFELLYGSGDRGTEEYIGNKAVAACNKDATRLLRRVQKEGRSGSYKKATTGAPYVRYRYWSAPLVRAPIPWLHGDSGST